MILLLSLLILVHEAGHFFAARAFGIKVEKFGFGLPVGPTLFKTKKNVSMEYTKILPDVQEGNRSRGRGSLQSPLIALGGQLQNFHLHDISKS